MNESKENWRDRVYEIIFEAETPTGKRFDVALLWLILLSLVVVSLESVESLRQEYGTSFYWIELVITAFFSVEYVLRLLCVRKPLKYATSFFGVIDLLAIIPFYLGLFVTGAQSLIVVRTLRLLRVFRVLKLRSFVGEGYTILTALSRSRHKITVFLLAVVSIAMIVGTFMYLVEGSSSGFNSIPQSFYWAIVTMTTVGYGDLSPATPVGQFAAIILMLSGYCIIAVPTGIVSVELARSAAENTRTCKNCLHAGHDADAKHCKRCGESL